MNVKGVITGFLLVACTGFPAAGSPSDGQTRANEPTTTPTPGSRFREALRSGGEGPEMVVIPAGRFRIGCLSNDDHCRSGSSRFQTRYPDAVTDRPWNDVPRPAALGWEGAGDGRHTGRELSERLSFER